MTQKKRSQRGEKNNGPMQKRGLITLFILCIASFWATDIRAREFYSINDLYDISMRMTNSICKDDHGFVWASSRTGVIRLSDDSYRMYSLPYKTTGAMSVKLLFEDSELTAYTNNGQIFVYNSVYDQFNLLVNLGSLLRDQHFEVYTLVRDTAEDYWIASNAGIYRYHGGNLELIDNSPKGRYLIARYDDESLIIVQKEKIRLLDTRSLQSKELCEIRSKSWFSASSLFLDKEQNKLWIGTFSSGLSCYHFNSGTLAQILPDTLPGQPVLAIEANSDSTLLIGIDGQGLWEISKKGDKLLDVYKESADDPHSLRGNGVYDIYNDHGKRIWIATLSGGVSFFDQISPLVTRIFHQTNHKNSLINNEVNSIIEDRNGKIWFATNNGINCWDPGLDQWRHFYDNKLKQTQVFLTLCEDDQGRIWAGSYSSGVYVLDGQTGRELAHYSGEVEDIPAINHVISNYIYDIYKDSQGDIWIGGSTGKIICYQAKENKFRSYATEALSSFAELSPNQMLIGNSHGISLLDKQTGRINPLLPDITVQDLFVAGNEIWIGTSGEGLVVYHYKDKSIEKYTVASGLPSDFINSITYADHYLWLGTENGLCRINPEDKTARTFSSIISLSGVSYNKGANCILKNKKLALGTNDGALLFDPESLIEIPLKGRIFFQDILVAGRSIRDIPAFKLDTPIDSLSHLSLDYFQNTLSIEVLPIGAYSGTKFSWKLEGFDSEWSTPTGNRMITYTNIPSGKFTLKIKLLNNSVTHVISERSIAIRMIPPFWKTGWFWILLMITVSGMILLYFLYYINKLKQSHAEEKVRFLTNTAHEIRTTLTLISAPVEELNKEPHLTEAGTYYLNLVIGQVRRLSSVVTRWMDFQKADIGKEQLYLSMMDIVKLIANRRMILEPFAKSRHIELIFHADRDSYITAVDEYKMEKIIDNLITNAIKYSPEKSQVQIELRCDKKKWTLQVEDHGIGISKKSQNRLFKEFYRADNAVNSKVVGSGIGLLLVHRYVKLHGGTIRCNSRENSGSIFQITIPCKKVSGEVKTAPAITNPESVFSKKIECTHQPEEIQINNKSKSLTILIVEDNDDLRNFMQKSLCQEFNIITAEDGIQAWTIIQEQIPDMVVSDVMMPEMDGFALCKNLKSTYETSHVPIILLTALSEKTEQLHGLKLGADDYLTKPFDMELLTQRIKSIVLNRTLVRDKAFKLLKTDIATPVILENELNDKFLKKIYEVAKANISNSEFSKEEFASALNMSSSLLYKKTKALTGLSPTDFIKTLRLDHASELLLSRKYTVTEISELCGFSSVGYFSTVFRKHFGKSPTDL